MAETVQRMADDMGCVLFDGAVIVYKLVPEIEARTAAYTAGGTITHHVATGRRTIQAIEFGRPPFIPITPELRAAIDHDLQKRGITL